MSPSCLPCLFQGLITQLDHFPGIALKSLLGQFNANSFISQQGIEKQPRSIIYPNAMLLMKPLDQDSHDWHVLTLHRIIHTFTYFHLVYHHYVLASGYIQRDTFFKKNTTINQHTQFYSRLQYLFLFI